MSKGRALLRLLFVLCSAALLLGDVFPGLPSAACAARAVRRARRAGRRGKCSGLGERSERPGRGVAGRAERASSRSLRDCGGAVANAAPCHRERRAFPSPARGRALGPDVVRARRAKPRVSIVRAKAISAGVSPGSTPSSSRFIGIQASHARVLSCVARSDCIERSGDPRRTKHTNARRNSRG